MEMRIAVTSLDKTREKLSRNRLMTLPKILEDRKKKVGIPPSNFLNVL
jgi:hypothetical protein